MRMSRSRPAMPERHRFRSRRFTRKTARRRVAAMAIAALACALTAQTGMTRLHDESSAARRTPSDTGRRIALLMGVSDYKYFPPSGSAGESDLEGPRNDLPRMRHALERWGFSGDDNVRVLADSMASRLGILAGFDWVTRAVTSPNDAVVIYWSGHGSWAPDLDGDEAKLDAADKDDEALVPWDAQDIHDPRQLVLDDDIRRFLDGLKTKNVTVIVDACYSGTITRGAGPRARGPLPPPNGGRGGLDAVDGPNNHVLFTAASANQTSYEVRFGADSTTAFGVFTYFFTEAMDRADPAVRADELYHDVLELVRTYPHSIAQTPQLEGVRSARLFHVNGDAARLPFVTLSSVGAAVTIAAGAVHGVRVGAEYEVFGPRESKFNGPSLGRIVVDSVHTIEALAHADSGGPFPPNARGILARAPAGAMALQRLDVFVDSSAIRFANSLQKYPWLHVTESRGAPVELSFTGTLLRVLHRGHELVPIQANQSAHDTITEKGRKHVITGFRPSTPLCEPLARAFGAEALTEIHNPLSPKLLELKLRLVPSGKHPAAQDSSTADTAWIGDKYDLYARVDAPRQSRLYTSIALEGLTAETRMLYPDDRSSSGLFELNKWVPVRRELPAQEPPGIDVLKAVTSSHQYDFASLINSLPVCQRRVTEDKFAESADQIGGWTDTERQVVFMRRPKRVAK